MQHAFDVKSTCTGEQSSDLIQRVEQRKRRLTHDNEHITKHLHTARQHRCRRYRRRTSGIERTIDASCKLMVTHRISFAFSSCLHRLLSYIARDSDTCSKIARRDNKIIIQSVFWGACVRFIEPLKNGDVCTQSVSLFMLLLTCVSLRQSIVACGVSVCTAWEFWTLHLL